MVVEVPLDGLCSSRFANAPVEHDAASVHAKGGALREWLKQSRRAIAEMAAQMERSVSVGIRDAMRLLDAGKRFQAIKKINELAKAITPKALEMIREAGEAIKQRIEVAAEI